MTIKTTAIRAVNSVLAALPGVVNPWAGKAWGIDVYDPAKMTFAKGDIDFVGLRLGGTSNGTIYTNPNFGEQVQAVWDAGAIPMAYWIVDGDYYPTHEWTEGSLKNCTDDKNPVLTAIKNTLRSGNTAWKKVGILFWDCETASNEAWEALYVDDLRGRICNQQSKGEFPKLLQGIYSRASWINGRVPLRTLVENHPELVVWTANYMTSFPGKYSPIAQKRTNELPLITQKPFWYGEHPEKPKLYPRMFQYHGTGNNMQYSTCPEVVDRSTPIKPMGLDLDVMECTRADLYKIVGWADPLVVVPPPPDPEPTPDLTALTARVTELERILDFHHLKGE